MAKYGQASKILYNFAKNKASIVVHAWHLYWFPTGKWTRTETFFSVIVQLELLFETCSSIFLWVESFWTYVHSKLRTNDDGVSSRVRYQKDLLVGQSFIPLSRRYSSLKLANWNGLDVCDFDEKWKTIWSNCSTNKTRYSLPRTHTHIHL